jgi:integrase
VGRGPAAAAQDPGAALPGQAPPHGPAGAGPGACYTPSSYANAVARGVAKANASRACGACRGLRPGDRCGLCKAAVPHFHPHQLRHAKATEIRREAGIDAGRAVLGHRSPQVTETYAAIDMAKAAEVIARLG